MNEMRKKFEDEFSKHVKDNTCSGECSMCGRCCGNILGLNMDDFYRIQDYLNKNDIQPSQVRILTGSDGNEVETCPFLGDDDRCMIYEARPVICRKFICNAGKMFEAYDEDGILVPDEIGQVDMRKTFFNGYC